MKKNGMERNRTDLLRSPAVQPGACSRRKREKSLYDVYIVARRCFGDFVITERYFVSSTFAVSEKKAVNNVRFNQGDSCNFFHDSDPYSDDWREFFYQAVPSRTNLPLFEKTTKNEYYQNGGRG